MPNLVAVILVVGLAVERGFSEWLHAKERRYLTNAAIAKTPGELKQLEAKVPRKRPEPVSIDGFDGQVGI